MQPSDLLEQTFRPTIEAMRQLELGIETGDLRPAAVFERYAEIYQALYAAGQFGELLMDQVATGLAPADAEALRRTYREDADAGLQKFRQELLVDKPGG